MTETLAKGLGRHLKRMRAASRMAGRSLSTKAIMTGRHLADSAGMGVQAGAVGGALYGLGSNPTISSTLAGLGTGAGLGLAAAPAISLGRYGYQRWGAKGSALGVLPFAGAYAVKRTLSDEEREQRRNAGKASANKRHRGGG